MQSVPRRPGAGRSQRSGPGGAGPGKKGGPCERRRHPDRSQTKGGEMGKQRAPRSENRKESSGLWPASHGDGKEVRREAHWLLGEAGLSPHIPSRRGPLLRHPDLPAHRGTAAAAQPRPTSSPCPSSPATCPPEHTGLRRGCSDTPTLSYLWQHVFSEVSHLLPLPPFVSLKAPQQEAR